MRDPGLQTDETGRGRFVGIDATTRHGDNTPMNARDISSMLVRSGTAPHPFNHPRLPRMRLLAVLLAGGGCLLASATVLAAGGDNQATATCISAFPYNDTGTTVGATDGSDLPPDTTFPTLTATCAASVTGGGPAGSLPNGAIYTGTGTGPDVVYRMDFPAGNADTLTITMDPTGAQDLGVTVFCNTVSSALADGLVIDDSGVGGVAEVVQVGGVVPGTTLYIVVDGYSTGATPPGPSGPYSLSVTSNGAIQPDPTCGAAPSADLSITKDDGAANATPGDSTTYTIVASNAGPSNVTGATIADTFPAACTAVNYTAVAAGGATGFTAAGAGNINDLVDLPAGSSVTYTAICDIDAGATGTLDNTTTIASGTDDPVPGNNEAADSDTLVPSNDLAITKDDGTATAAPGGTTVYTIIASNAGPSNAVGATVADTFPAACTTVNYTAVEAGGATGFTAAGVGNINDLVDMPVGSSVTYTATCNIDAGATGTLDNTASIVNPSDDNNGNNEASDSDTLVPSTDLAITKTDGTPTAVPGGATVYTITASNTGPSDASGATIADPFPAACTSVAYTAVSAGSATGFTAAGAGDINDTVDMPVGSSVTYTATCNIDAGATGTLDNTASISGPDDGNNGNNEASDSDILGGVADLSIVKTVDTSALADGVISYTIVVGSAGPSTVAGAAVSDLFASPLTDVEWNCTGTGGGTCTTSSSGDIADVVTLPPGGVLTYIAVADIPAPLEEAVSNTATVEAPVGVVDGNLSNNSSTVTVQPVALFSDGFEEPIVP